jgi:hypothetical protein
MRLHHWIETYLEVAKKSLICLAVLSTVFLSGCDEHKEDEFAGENFREHVKQEIEKVGVAATTASEELNVFRTNPVFWLQKAGLFQDGPGAALIDETYAALLWEFYLKRFIPSAILIEGNATPVIYDPLSDAGFILSDKISVFLGSEIKGGDNEWSLNEAESITSFIKENIYNLWKNPIFIADDTMNDMSKMDHFASRLLIITARIKELKESKIVCSLQHIGNDFDSEIRNIIISNSFLQYHYRLPIQRNIDASPKDMSIQFYFYENDISNGYFEVAFVEHPDTKKCEEIYKIITPITGAGSSFTN